MLQDGLGWKHPRMWAQYGDGHRGVVLVFDRRRLLENAQRSLAGRGSLLFGDVLYTQHHHPGNMLPFIVSHSDWMRTPHAELAARHLAAHGDWLFFTKDVDWAQERESRLVLFGNSDAETLVGIDGALIEICLGDLVSEADAKVFSDAASVLGCHLSRASWRNGLAVRYPVTT